MNYWKNRIIHLSKELIALKLKLYTYNEKADSFFVIFNDLFYPYGIKDHQAMRNLWQNALYELPRGNQTS